MNWIIIVSIILITISLILWFYIEYGICSRDSGLYNGKQCANIVWNGYLSMIKGFGIASGVILLIEIIQFKNRNNKVKNN
jgi:hypothetical protein